MLFIVQSPYSFTIGHRGVFSLARWAGPLRTEFHELRATLECLSTPIVQLAAYGAFTRSGRPFQAVPLAAFQLEASTTPGRTPVWAVPRSLAATDGITIVFSSCGYLDVSVPRVRHVWLCIHHTLLEHYLQWVSPFGNLRVKACLAAHRSLSQLTTSFIASLCLGIHRTPLVA